MPSIQVGLRIPESLHQQMMDYTKKVGISKSEVMISALKHYLEFAPDIPLSERIDKLEKKIAALETKSN